MRVLFFLFSLVLCLNAQQTKIVYLRLLSPLDMQRELYVGETLELKYSLLLFSNASLLDVEFIPNDDLSLANGVELLNPNSNWIKKEDDSYENTFFYKIKSSNFALPALKISALSEDGSYADSDTVKGKRLEAVPLMGEFYSGVVAKEMKISGVRAKKYDDWNNIMIFTLQTQDGNLEDFKLQTIEKQGFNGDIEKQRGIKKGNYYGVFPSNLQELKFTFFNLTTLHYEEKILPILIENDRVSTQADLEPKNNFLIFSNLIYIAIVIVGLLIAWIGRKQRVIFYPSILVAFGAFGFFLFSFFAVKEGILKSGSRITILPTKNSTIMQTTSTPLKVEIIGSHEKFYKIKLDDSKIGWVKKNDCQ